MASKPTLRERVARREVRSSLEGLTHRAEELTDVLASSDLADFTVEPDGRALPDIALEVLRKAGWLDAAAQEYPGQHDARQIEVPARPVS